MNFGLQRSRSPLLLLFFFFSAAAPTCPGPECRFDPASANPSVRMDVSLTPGVASRNLPRSNRPPRNSQVNARSCTAWILGEQIASLLL